MRLINNPKYIRMVYVETNITLKVTFDSYALDDIKSAIKSIVSHL